MLRITEQAREAIAAICAEGGAGAEGGLRISAAGSNGETALEFELADVAAEGDEVVRDGDAVLFLDPTASAMLADKMLDVHAHGDHFHFSIDEQ
jgi:Fe-S cluster assembly iron-binding protein IscA